MRYVPGSFLPVDEDETNRRRDGAVVYRQAERPALTRGRKTPRTPGDFAHLEAAAAKRARRALKLPA